MLVKENYSLKDLNTFGVDAYARWFVQINHEQELQELFSDAFWSGKKRLILGGGSNMLLVNNFDGLVIQMNIRGIRYRMHENTIHLTAGAGEPWKDLVTYCVDKNFAGLENLSLIPGRVGASPIQNIGAYGVELSTVFYSCKAFDIASQQSTLFYKEDCLFGYRDSIFKRKLKNKVIITEVTYELSPHFKATTQYQAVEQELKRRNLQTPTLRQMAELITELRVNKLPDPSTIGNAGSFFKNPMVDEDHFKMLQAAFPHIVFYPAPRNKIKLAAAWLIEECGWKGKIVGNTGTWKHQALVLVNQGKATGQEIFNFSARIIESVQERFGVRLEPEVNIIH